MKPHPQFNGGIQHTEFSGTETNSLDRLPVSIECAGLTDIGRKRKVNQDQFLIADLHKNMQVQCSSEPFQNKCLFGSAMGKLLVVADGMGGALAGEVASEMAVETLGQYLLNSMHWLFHPTSNEIEQFLLDLKNAARQSHETIRTTAANEPGFAGMGTTLTVAYLTWPMMYVLHVGDSRCYVLRQGVLHQITKDQTLAQHLHDRGHLDDREFNESPYRHVLLSVIGGNEDYPDIAVFKTKLAVGDRILLCSDGVNAHLKTDEIEQVLSVEQSATDVCRKLISAANECGGEDNITAVVALSRASAE